MSTAEIQLNDPQTLYRRWEDSGDEVIVAANFSGDRQRLGVPLPGEGAWKEFFTEEVIQASRAQTRELGPWTAEIFVREP